MSSQGSLPNPSAATPRLWPSSRPPHAPPRDTTDDQNPDLPPRPLPNSYWATPHLLGSEYPGGPTTDMALPRLKALLDVGVVDFIDLTEERELVPYAPLLQGLAVERDAEFMEFKLGEEVTPYRPTPSTIRYGRFPIRDRSIPSQEGLKTILNALFYSRALDRKAVVHCWGGIGRTGTIVGCWLVHSGEVTDAVDASSGAVQTAGQRALEVLKEKWKGVDKSWRAPRTPETALQADMVRLFRPPVAP